MANLKLKIVTPEKVVYESEISQVTVPTSSGQITILSNHLPLISVLAAGELIIWGKDKSETPMAISGGFVQVAKNEVTILADTAERSEEIDEARARAAREKALQLLSEVKNRESVEYTALAAKMEKELARLRVARKRRAPHYGPEINP
ncbi:MAG TPA: ATP synthase F1 subunit epsilon [Patescibacteria group bacterium]|nr:ATP synthase F1 subunit epsilon [Patescibacteria group bacterium]